MPPRAIRRIAPVSLRARFVALAALFAVGLAVVVAGNSTDDGGTGGRTPIPPAPEIHPHRTKTGAVSAYKGLWISTRQIARLPREGQSWRAMQTIARGGLGSADLADQSNMHGTRAFAAALVYARTGDATYRAKVHAAIMSAIGTEEGARSLALGRNLTPYVLAADLINLEALSRTDGRRFREWIGGLRTRSNEGNSRWPTLVQTSENTSSNWGAFALASRIATDLYLGDTADLRQVASIHLAYADRSKYPTGKPWGGYFQPTADFDPANWACGDVATWVAINPPCLKNGHDINGALVEDISREEAQQTVLPQPPGSSGVSYSWETLQALTVQAELLRRAGYPTLWETSGQALRRATAFMQRAGWYEDASVAHYVPWLVNKRYGTSFPTRTGGYGRLVGFTDWTHARSRGEARGR